MSIKQSFLIAAIMLAAFDLVGALVSAQVST